MTTTATNGQADHAPADLITTSAASLLGVGGNGNASLDPAAFAQTLQHLAAIAQQLGAAPGNGTQTVLTSLPLYSPIMAQVVQHLTTGNTLIQRLYAIARDVEQAQAKLLTARRQAMAEVTAVEAIDLSSAVADPARLRELVKLAGQAVLAFERLSEAAAAQAEILEQAQIN
jgi:hypothetical protein